MKSAKLYPDGITNYGIAELIYGKVSGQGTRNEAFVLPDYAEVHQQMTSRKNMTLIDQLNIPAFVSVLSGQKETTESMIDW